MIQFAWYTPFQFVGACLAITLAFIVAYFLALIVFVELAWLFAVMITPISWFVPALHAIPKYVFNFRHGLMDDVFERHPLALLHGYFKKAAWVG